MEGASVGSCRLGLTRRACIYLLEARIGAWAKAQSAVAIVNLVAQPEVSFAILGVKAFDGEAFRPEQDVWIEDGRIRRVGEGLDLPEDLLRVDGRGRTLVPGLIDGHVHTYGSTRQRRRALRSHDGARSVHQSGSRCREAPGPRRAGPRRRGRPLLRRHARGRARRARHAVRRAGRAGGSSGRCAGVGAGAQDRGVRLDQDRVGGRKHIRHGCGCFGARG